MKVGERAKFHGEVGQLWRLWDGLGRRAVGVYTSDDVFVVDVVSDRQTDDSSIPDVRLIADNGTAGWTWRALVHTIEEK